MDSWTGPLFRAEAYVRGYHGEVWGRELRILPMPTSHLRWIIANPYTVTDTVLRVVREELRSRERRYGD